jgi:apolipoprotein N-acyltransferase
MRVLRIAVAALVGAIASLAVVIESGRWWGLLLGYAAVLATTYACPPGWTTRLPFGLAYLVVLVVALQPRPEGDFLISADVTGYLVMGLGLVVMLATLSTLPRPTGWASGPSTPQNGDHGQDQ